MATNLQLSDTNYRLPKQLRTLPVPIKKLMPYTIPNAISGEPQTIYGKCDQIIDLLYIDDNAKAE